MSVLAAGALTATAIAPALALTPTKPVPDAAAAATQVKPQTQPRTKQQKSKQPKSMPTYELKHHTVHQQMDLSGHDLSGSVAHNSDFRKVTLHHAHLHRGVYHHSKFDGVVMHHISAHHSDFSQSSMRDAVAHHSNFRASKIHDTDLTGADLRGSDFTNADLSNAMLSPAKLHKAKLDGATAHHADFSGASIHYASLRKFQAHHAKFAGARLHHSDLTGAVVHNGDFSKVVMHKATMRKAVAHHSRFIGATLDRTDFRGADLRNSNFSSGTHDETHGVKAATFGAMPSSMTGINAANANLSGSNLSGVNLSNANLSGANLSGANLNGANLNGANLNGANMTGATTQGATLPGGANAVSSLVCTSTTPMSNFSFGGGVTGSITPSAAGSGTVTVSGPNGISFSGTYSCSHLGWTLTITGATGTFSTPIPGLAVNLTGVTGTIRRTTTQSAVWNIDIPFTMAKAAHGKVFTVNGDLSVAGTDAWTLNASSGTLPSGLTDSDGSALAASGFSGSVTYSSGAVTGSFAVAIAGQTSSQTKMLQHLPAGWTTSMTLQLDMSKGATDAAATVAVDVAISATSGDLLDRINFTGAWSPQGYVLDASGTLKIKARSATVGGWYKSKGYLVGSQPLPEALWSVTADFNGVSLGNGATLSGTITASSTTPGIAGSVTVKPIATQDFALTANLAYTSSTVWSVTLNGQSNSTSWSPSSAPGLTIDPNGISGTISSTQQGTTWNVSLSSLTWASSKAGFSVTTSASLSSTCPLSGDNACGTATGPFFGFTNASLTFPSPMGTVTAQGAIQLDGSWGYVKATPSNFNVSGPGGASIGLTNASVALWIGSKPAPAVPNVSLPDISSLSDGIGVEFCGTFNASIPGLTTVDTGGCVDYTSSGIVIGQVNSALASIPAASNGTISTSGGSLQGWLWSNLSTTKINNLSSSTATLGGRSMALLSQVSQFTGNIALPGAVMHAMGKTAVDTNLPASLTFAYNGSFQDSNFDLKASVPISLTTGGFTLNTLTFDIKKSGSNFSLALDADATATLDGNTYALRASFAASTGGGFSLSFIAQGTGPCGSSCDGVTAPLANPQSGYTYLTDSFFGMSGLHLWSLRAQIGWDNGSPEIGVGSTTYIDPTKAPGFVGTTWLKGGSDVNFSYTAPCFSFGFSSTDPSTYLKIKNGVFTARNFSLAIAAPTACTVAGVTIPAGVSLNFDGTLGGSTIDIALMLGKDSSGNPMFSSSTAVSNLTWAGITYNTMDLEILLTTSSQTVSFDGLMTMPVGKVAGDFDLSVNDSTGAVKLDGDVCVNTQGCQSGTNYTLDGGDLAVNSFQFHLSMDTSNAAFSATTGGNMTVGKKSYTFTGTIQVNNGVLQQLSFDYKYSHGGSQFDIGLDYDKNAHTIAGGFNWQYKKETSHKHLSTKYTRGITVDLSMYFSMDTNNPGSGKLTFTGTMDGANISGSVTCTLTASGDDSAHADIDIHINKDVHWGDSWDW